MCLVSPRTIQNVSRGCFQDREPVLLVIPAVRLVWVQLNKTAHLATKTRISSIPLVSRSVLQELKNPPHHVLLVLTLVQPVKTCPVEAANLAISCRMVIA